jgi:hypothetical protein
MDAVHVSDPPDDEREPEALARTAAELEIGTSTPGPREPTMSAVRGASCAESVAPTTHAHPAMITRFQRRRITNLLLWVGDNGEYGAT